MDSMTNTKGLPRDILPYRDSETYMTEEIDLTEKRKETTQH